MRETEKIGIVVAVVMLFVALLVIIALLFPSLGLAAGPTYMHGRVQDASGVGVRNSIVSFKVGTKIYQSPPSRGFSGNITKNASEWWGVGISGMCVEGTLSAKVDGYNVVGYYIGGNYVEGREIKVDPCQVPNAIIDIVVEKIGITPTVTPAPIVPQPISTPSAGQWVFYGTAPAGTKIALYRESQKKGESVDPSWRICVTGVPGKYFLEIMPPAGLQVDSVTYRGWLKLRQDENGRYFFWIGNILQGQMIGPIVVSLK